ncbi:hypothetical protein IFM89_009488 [Coptis chinensis]|uniref:Uncharacterized protein n=1 Tax=Coptis chinensis TaxID=261450 RepID=A0A835I0E5_9MAGN|nr:hypothetical protein IFM89_009488 [Coptis chinensis]
MICSFLRENSFRLNIVPILLFVSGGMLSKLKATESMRGMNFLSFIADLYHYRGLTYELSPMKKSSLEYYGNPEGKPVLEDKLSEVTTHLLSTYDNGELTVALEEGHTDSQKWVKSFGKSMKRKLVPIDREGSKQSRALSRQNKKEKKLS